MAMVVKTHRKALRQSIRDIFQELISEEEFKELWWKRLHSRNEYVAMDALRMATQYLFGKPAHTPIHPNDMAPETVGHGPEFALNEIVTRHVPVQ
jgi:hypothetical protein